MKNHQIWLKFGKKWRLIQIQTIFFQYRLLLSKIKRYFCASDYLMDAMQNLRNSKRRNAFLSFLVNFTALLQTFTNTHDGLKSWKKYKLGSSKSQSEFPQMSSISLFFEIFQRNLLIANPELCIYSIFFSLFNPLCYHKLD